MIRTETSRRGRSLSGLAAALAVVVVLTCGAGFAASGDSVTRSAREELAERRGFVRAFGGVDIQTGRRALRRFARADEQRVVIALGLMDVARFATAAELEQRIRAVYRDDVAQVPCVLWIDLTLNSNIHDDWVQRASTFNGVLNSVAKEFWRPVAHWSEVSAGRDHWFRPDGIHLNPLGQRRYAEFVTRSLQNFCGAS